MTTIINHAHNSSATIEWNGYHWVAELNGTRYADCNDERLTKRLYDAGAETVFELVETPRIVTMVSNASSGLLKRN